MNKRKNHWPVILLAIIVGMLCIVNLPVWMSGLGGDVHPQLAPLEFKSPEEFAKYERQAKTGTVSFYYIPSQLPEGFKLKSISKRDDVYVSVAYTVELPKESTSDLTSYAVERMSTLICQYYLFEDGNVTLQGGFLNNGFREMEYNGRTIYVDEEYDTFGNPKQLIGYEIAFLADGQLVYMHLPALDTFETMMQYANVVKVELG